MSRISAWHPAFLSSVVSSLRVQCARVDARRIPPWSSGRSILEALSLMVRGISSNQPRRSKQQGNGPSMESLCNLALMYQLLWRRILATELLVSFRRQHFRRRLQMTPLSERRFQREGGGGQFLLMPSPAWFLMWLP